MAGSEAGTVALDPATIVEKGRLGPGQMVLVDTARGVVLRNHEIKADIAARAPYAEWLAANRVPSTSGRSWMSRSPVPVDADAKTRARR